LRGNFDLELAPIVHAIFSLRGKILGSSRAPRQSLGLVSAMTALGWGKLAEIPGRELIMGAVMQPWRPDVYFAAVPPERFASYSEPDHVKIVWTLEAEALGAALTRFRTQTRAVATDPIARKKFRRAFRQDRRRCRSQ